jgi:hypothetical protein
VIAVLGGLFALDVVMVQYLESRGASEMAKTMAAEEAEIDLGGFPFLPRFLTGSLSNVSALVTGASANGGLRVQSVEARAGQIEFSAGQIFALARSSFATKSRVTAKQALVILELGEGDLNDFIRRSIPVVGDVQVKASGIEVRFLKPDVDPADAVHPSDDNLTKPARFLPGTRDRKLHLILTGVSQIPPDLRNEANRLEDLIDLPRFPEGLDPDVSMRDGVIVIEAQGAEVSLEIGEGAE